MRDGYGIKRETMCEERGSDRLESEGSLEPPAALGL